MTIQLAAIIVLAIAIVLSEVRNYSLRKDLRDLKADLKDHYWTKETIARNYGEPPLEKKEAEKRQDAILKKAFEDAKEAAKL
jgi:predicted Holliday junction resolvase-like endonuclease